MSKAMTKKSLTDQTLEYLQSQIRKGNFPGGLLPKEEKLAENLKISRTTLRRALAILEKEGKIIRRKALGTFVSDSFQMEIPRYKKLGVLCAREATEKDFLKPLSLYGDIFSHLLNEASKENYSLSSLVIDPEQKSQSIEQCKHHDLDGYILMAITNEEILHRLEELRKPILLVDHWTESINLDAVNVDSYLGAKQAVNHLVEFGHKKIAFINWHHWKLLNQERYEGYLDGLKENGIKQRNNLLEEFSGRCKRRV